MNLIALLFGFLLALASCAPVYAGLAVTPGTPAHTHSDANTGGGTLALSGTLSSTKSCTNGVRVIPSYCKREPVANESWTDATACTARTFSPALPADAKLVHMEMVLSALSNNAIAERTNDVNFYTDAACSPANWAGTVTVGVREFAAVAAGNVIGRWTYQVFVRLGAANTIYTTQTNAGGNGNADVISIRVLGYVD